MRARLAIAVVAMLAARAHADEPAPDEAVMGRIRELYAKGDYLGVRSELLSAYEKTKHPSLLFALGQVELNLGNNQAAIDFYERFIATNPTEEQVALAQQAIGAARMRMTQKRTPVPPPRRRTWRTSDTIVVAAGGAAVALGAGAFFYGRRLGNDHGGTLAAYDARADRARTYQWLGGGLVAAGLVTVGVALVRWRLRPDEDAAGEITITASGSSAAVSVTW